MENKRRSKRKLVVEANVKKEDDQSSVTSQIEKGREQEEQDEKEQEHTSGSSSSSRNRSDQVEEPMLQRTRGKAVAQHRALFFARGITTEKTPAGVSLNTAAPETTEVSSPTIPTLRTHGANEPTSHVDHPEDHRNDDYHADENEHNDSIYSWPNVQSESWPGPFATARILHQARPAAKAAREEELLGRAQQEEDELVEVKAWKPREPRRKLVSTTEHKIPTLSRMVLEFLAKYIDHVESLEYLSEDVRRQLAQTLCASRKLGPKAFSLFTGPEVRELDIPDCSYIEEGVFVEAIHRMKLDCGLPTLDTMKLGYCGRCISDKVIYNLGSSLNQLTVLSLGGCYRISDEGIQAIATHAPLLRCFDIGSNQRITGKSMASIATLKHLEQLGIRECPQLSPEALQPLTSICNLQRLALVQMVKVTDDFLVSFSIELTRLRELSLASCHEVSDVSLCAILTHARQLSVLDLSDVSLITDVSLKKIHSMQTPLQTVTLKRCSEITDEGMEAMLQGCAGYLAHLELSSVPGITNKTLVSLARHCSDSLKHLDVSFCRGISDHGLGHLTDRCTKLEQLVLWGCTQITSTFLCGHGLDNLIVEGHPLITGLRIRY